MPHHAPPSALRRSLSAALVFAPALWLGARAQSPAPRRPTPSQTEGPFYPVALPRDSDADLLRNGTLNYAQGQPVWLDGTVVDMDGKPVRGAQVEIWQCDQAGNYHHPGDGDRADRSFQGFGKVVVGADGGYRFRTIKPAAYSGRTPHIHVKVRLGSRALLTTQLYVDGDAGNARDFLWRSLPEAERSALTVPFAPAADGLRATFPITLRT